MKRRRKRWLTFIAPRQCPNRLTCNHHNLPQKALAMDPDRNKLRANIEVKLTADGNRWYVAACSANIGNTNCRTFPLGEFFPSKDVGITEMKRRIMAWFKERGRKETEMKVEWRVP